VPICRGKKPVQAAKQYLMHAKYKHLIQVQSGIMKKIDQLATQIAAL